MAVATGLMNEAQWRERVFGGAWEPAQGGSVDVREPASRDVLTRVGLAGPADVAAAAQRAAAAQPAWAELAPQERAQIFRDAANLVKSSGDDIKHWMVRETGSIPPKIDVELKMAEGILNQSAAMLGEPQ